MKRSSVILGVIAVLALVGISQSVFVVDETERAIVLQQGKPMGETLGPGLHFKLPLVQNALYFDARILDYGAKAAEILTRDKKTMVVDNYSRWRITDPLQFYRTLRTEQRAQARLEDIIYAELRVVLGRYSLHELVSEKRAEIMTLVTTKTNELLRPPTASSRGRAHQAHGLPPQNEQAIFQPHALGTHPRGQAVPLRGAGGDGQDQVRSRPRAPRSSWPRPSARPTCCAARATPRPPRSSPRPSNPRRTSIPSCAASRPTRPARRRTPGGS
jgi:membrane protease subunit HflC